MKEREHLRCPVCGKLSRGPAFDVGANEGHRLDSMIQTFRGGRGRGFLWRSEMLGREGMVALEEVIRRVLARLRSLLGLPPLVELPTAAIFPRVSFRPPLVAFKPPVVALRPKVYLRSVHQRGTP